MTTDDMAWAPDACTLPTAERPIRQAEFDSLFRTAVIEIDRRSPTEAVFRLEADEDEIRDLAARERECCTFFDFAVARDADGIVSLKIGVPPAYSGVLAAMLARAEAVR